MIALAWWGKWEWAALVQNLASSACQSELLGPLGEPVDAQAALSTLAAGCPTSPGHGRHKASACAARPAPPGLLMGSSRPLAAESDSGSQMACSWPPWPPWPLSGGGGDPPPAPAPAPLCLVPGICGTQLAVRPAGAGNDDDGERCWVKLRSADASFQRLWGRYSRQSGRVELLAEGDEACVPSGGDPSGLYPITGACLRGRAARLVERAAARAAAAGAASFCPCTHARGAAPRLCSAGPRVRLCGLGAAILRAACHLAAGEQRLGVAAATPPPPPL